MVELGFGYGLNLPWLPTTVTGLWAVEPSGTATNLAKKRMESAPVPVHVAGLDGAHLDLPDGRFDGALSTMTLCTIPDVSSALEELRRVLKPAGSFHFAEHGHSRLPIYHDNLDDIIGIVHIKDLLPFVVDGATFSLKKIMREAMFIAPSIRVLDLLLQMRLSRAHMALVVDEYGALQGLITLEDILDEIFGDLPDEHEEEGRPDVRKRPDGSYLIDGTVPIRELNRELDWSLPDEEATTIAGLVIHEARAIPEAGQSFTFHGFRFRVLKKQRNRITALHVAPLHRKPVAKVA